MVARALCNDGGASAGWARNHLWPVVEKRNEEAKPAEGRARPLFDRAKKHRLYYSLHKKAAWTRQPGRFSGESSRTTAIKSEGTVPKIVDEQMRETTRRHIIQIAAREFARLGFEQANINTIAELAGMGKGTIYLYFENKRELFLAMLRVIAQTQLASVRSALAAGGTLRERLERLFQTFVRLAVEDEDGFNVYMSALYGVNRAFKEEATYLLRDYVAVIALLLEQSRAQGEVGDQEVNATALMVISLTESYVLSARVLGQSPAEILKQAPAIAQLILQGIESAAVS